MVIRDRDGNDQSFNRTKSGERQSQSGDAVLAALGTDPL